MDIKIPEVGESVFEATIASWHRKSGETVHKGELLVELETDKVNVEITAEADGVLSVAVEEGQTVEVGAVIGAIEEQAEKGAGEKRESAPKKESAGKEEPATRGQGGKAPARKEEPAGGGAEAVNPAARQMARARGIDLEEIEGTGPNWRVTVEDILAQAGERDRTSEAAGESAEPEAADEKKAPKEKQRPPEKERTTREPMTPMRKRIAERLLAARQQTAMLTTFNEVDMSRVQQLRARYREHFRQRHEVELGLMSFFVKATAEALKEFPEVNARIDGDDIVFHHYYDIGIAVGTERGLVVPVLRDADRLSFAA